MATPKEAKQEAIQNLLTRGVSEVIGAEHLKKRLAAGDTLRIKLGIDPTSPHVHLGRTVALLKLQDFQRMGHTPVFIVGDFTGVIGDTSDKESERPMLTQEVIEENKKQYLAQVEKIIDLEKAEFHYNSEWLTKLTYKEIGEHANQFSVADFIARENIHKRLTAGKRVSLREVLYPLMQGYDSVAVHADVEVGGTDQRFNMLAGRTLLTHYNKQPQSIIMGPLMPGLDGRKMSSSWGNTINVDDAADDMYGKVMSLHDDLVGTYFELCTRVPMSDVRNTMAQVAGGTLHPKDAKMKLAREVVTLYHGAAAADEAETHFQQVFREGRLPEEIQEFRTTQNTPLIDVLVTAGVISSRSEFRRLLDGGAIHSMSADGTTRIMDANTKIITPAVFKVGKRRFIRVVL